MAPSYESLWVVKIKAAYFKPSVPFLAWQDVAGSALLSAFPASAVPHALPSKCFSLEGGRMALSLRYLIEMHPG